jgi:hypothetical protein
MTYKEFESMLIENGIDYVKIVRTPDWRGGHRNWAYFNEEAKNHELQEFEYIEFEGDLNKAVEECDKVFFEQYESDGVTMSEGFTLWFIVEEEIKAMEL